MAAVCFAAMGLPAGAGAAGDAARGAVVFAMAGGCGCHTGKDGLVQIEARYVQFVY